MADVAQLVESQIVILVVAGSSPVVRPTQYASYRTPLKSLFIFPHETIGHGLTHRSRFF